MDQWLPPTAFLPPGRVAQTASGWTPWTVLLVGHTPHWAHKPLYSGESGLGGPSPSEWSPQQVVDAWTAAHDAYKVYESVDDLVAAWHTSLARQHGVPHCHARVPRVAAGQPHVQTAAGVRPMDAAGPATCHCPALHGRHALLHLHPLDSDRRARPTTLGSTRPHFCLDGGDRGAAGARSTGADSPQPRRHIP
jgi:hypothetical protein